MIEPILTYKWHLFSIPWRTATVRQANPTLLSGPRTAVMIFFFVCFEFLLFFCISSHTNNQKDNFWQQSVGNNITTSPDWQHENSNKQWLEGINSHMEGKTQAVQNQNHIKQQVVNLYDSVVPRLHVSRLVIMTWFNASAKLPNCFSFLQKPCILYCIH